MKSPVSHVTTNHEALSHMQHTTGDGLCQTHSHLQEIVLGWVCYWHLGQACGTRMDGRLCLDINTAYTPQAVSLVVSASTQ